MKNQKRSFHICLGIHILAVLLLTACGQPRTEQEETLPVPTEEPAATAQPREPFTEEELRQAISELKQGDETGAVLGSATLADGAYTGDVKVVYSDGEGNVTNSLQGTLENGVCVGELTVVYQGVEYSGTFQEDGTTAEEQVKEVTDQGGVLYAYGPGGRTYLYQENVEIADFRIGPAFFGLPEYVEWR